MTNTAAASAQSLECRLAANELRVAYDRFVALELQQFDVSGKIIALLGHNGAGKSTFIKTVLGLLPPKSGTLTTTLREGGTGEVMLRPESHMAFCPETGSVFADITVESYIRLWCRLKHRDARYYQKQGRRYMELLTIDPLLKKFGRELSKGQRRRVQTVIGFLTEPRLFLFDEPFDGLDVQKTNELAEIISNQTEQTAFIVSSHRMDVMERLADCFIVLREGKILTSGNLEKVCVDLCTRTLTVSNVSDLNASLLELRRKSPRTLVNRLGSQLFVTGAELTSEDIAGILAGIGETGVAVDAITPSLVDAMNYHLHVEATSHIRSESPK